MKRVFGLLLAVLLLIPATVKADIKPIWVVGYSNSTAVGSEIVVKLTGFRGFDGRLEYDSEELEYVSIRSGYEGDIYGGEEAIVTDNKDGKLSFKFDVDAQYKLNVWITFKVKSAKSDNVKITYYPKETSVLYGEESKVIEYPVIKLDAPIVDEQETPEVVEEPTAKKEETKCDNTCLYISWGVAGVFAISTLCLAISKKRK